MPVSSRRRDRVGRRDIAHRVAVLHSRQLLDAWGVCPRLPPHLGHDSQRQVPHPAIDEHTADARDRNQSEPVLQADFGNHRRRPATSRKIGQVNDDVLRFARRVNSAEHL